MQDAIGRVIFCCVLVNALAACSSSSRLSEQLSFKTLITTEGAKRFELNYPRPERKIDMTRSRSQDRDPYRDELTDRQLARYVDTLIAETGFCKSGYFLLGRHAGETTQKLRGECKDRATAADRERFTNTIDQW